MRKQTSVFDVCLFCPQLSHGYVVAGFNFQLDKNDNFRVKVTPSIVFQGINATTVISLEKQSIVGGGGGEVQRG